jgi:hypothetical protein
MGTEAPWEKRAFLIRERPFSLESGKPSERDHLFLDAAKQSGMDGVVKSLQEKVRGVAPKIRELHLRNSGIKE